MKAFVLAAGLGTRLKPWTLEHPKALVPVGGVPMLERVLYRLHAEGFDEVVINIHHFGEQILDWLESNTPEGMRVMISDERGELLDTGGAILQAESLLTADGEPFLIHNVDILSNAPLRRIYARHLETGNDVTMLVSHRESSRQLVFDKAGFLRGWHNVKDGMFKPAGFEPTVEMSEYAFSGIQVMSPTIFKEMQRQGREGKFSVIDFLLDAIEELAIRCYPQEDLQLIDIGKPATLSQANRLFNS